MNSDTNGVRVSGGAAPEELAAVLALLTLRHSAATPATGYERWRAERLKALRRKGSGFRDEM